MNFRIDGSFTDSLAKLTAQEPKAIKTTAFNLQINVSTPGMKIHGLGRAKGPNFGSTRTREHLLVTSVELKSEFLADFGRPGGTGRS